jgi:hypothetical protein
LSIIVEDQGVPHSAKNDLRPGGSQERELFDPDFNEGSKPSKASPAKVNLACRFMGGY